MIQLPNISGFSTAREDYIHVEEAHVSDAEDIENRMREVAAIADKTGLKRVLVDARHANGQLTRAEIAEIGRFAETTVSVLERIAMLRRVKGANDPWVGVTAALKTAGFTITMFENEQLALDWLRSPKTEP